MTDYTLPPLPSILLRQSDRDRVLFFGESCAEIARAPLLARIDELRGLLRLALADRDAIKARVAELEDERDEVRGEIAADAERLRTDAEYIGELEIACRELRASKSALLNRVGDLEKERDVLRLPAGWVAVPSVMPLSEDAAKSVAFFVGNIEDGFNETALFVGVVVDDDGAEHHGLAIRSADYPEEGACLLHEFVAAPEVKP